MQYVWGKNGNNNIYETDYYDANSYERDDGLRKGREGEEEREGVTET